MCIHPPFQINNTEHNTIKTSFLPCKKFYLSVRDSERQKQVSITSYTHKPCQLHKRVCGGTTKRVMVVFSSPSASSPRYWMFSFMAHADMHTPFHSLFCVFASLQTLRIAFPHSLCLSLCSCCSLFLHLPQTPWMEVMIAASCGFIRMLHLQV